jgi:hypothetical protein
MTMGLLIVFAILAGAAAALTVVGAPVVGGNAR